jgi:NADH-quinone oxidoreductase subunit G
VEKARKLLPACYTQVTDGMVVQTESARVVQARRAVLEFILVNHPVDCPICDQAGECKLQDYYLDYDAQNSRQRTVKVTKVKAFPLGPEVVYDGERCILCTRCVRFCDEVTGTNELTVVERGDRSAIRTFPGQDLDNAYSMCVVDLCPVGALTGRDFRFKCRVWLLSSADSVCTGCARGCSVHLEHHESEVQRLRPRYNPEVNEYWMCDEGRYTYRELHEDRLKTPQVNGASDTWPQLAQKTGDLLIDVVDRLGADALGFVFSPQASCEDLFAASQFCSQVLGSTDSTGSTRNYMGGKAYGTGDDFLIHADKNPNRNGALLMFERGSRPAPFTKLLADLESGTIQALYMMGSDIPLLGEQRARFLAAVEGLELFILQASRGGELSAHAKVILPVCTHAESEGTFVNCDGVAQHFDRAFAPKRSSAQEGWRVFCRLAQKMGSPLPYAVFHDLRSEMFRTMESNSQNPTAPAVADQAPTPA